MSTKPSNLPKSTATYITVPQETFNNILEYVSTGKIENIEVNYKEEAWENIPNIVPKSVFFLNHKLKKLQGQCKDTEKQIAQILSDSFMAGIKKELQNEKDKLGNFEENIHKEIENILKKFDVLDEINKTRNVLEEKDKVEEFYFHKFFKEEEVGAKRIREQKYLEIPQDGKWNEEAEELRRFNMKQLWYIVNKMLDQSCLNVKVSDMDGQMERMEKYFEEKMQKQFDELNTKCINLDKKIDIEKIALKKAFEKRDDEIFAYVENEIVGRLIEDESAIKTTVDIMEELKEDIDENRNFREKANERFEKMFKQNKDFFNTFEKKIVFYDENFEMMKTKTDQKLEDFRGQIDERFEVLKNETKEHVNFMNAEISRTMEENHKKYIENIEKLMSKTTKDLFALDFETKRVLENFRFEINKSGSEVSNKCQALDTKLDNFISTYIGFEVYAKTKIEPAFNNEAKVHALESRFGEHEEYVSNSTLLIRNILKKLIYAVQKNNLGQLKWLDDEEGYKERKSMGTPSSALITEVRESNAIGSINTLHEREDTFKQTYHQSWGRRLNSGAGFRKSGERFVNPLIHIDGSHNSDATGATLPGTAKSQKRNQSLDTDRVNLLKEEPTPTPKNKEFDSVLHKRLEVLRKALTDANFISQKYNDTVMRDMTNQNKDKPPKEVAPRNSFMTYYKDINLVKITSQGTKRKFSLNKSLNQPNSEFGDMHLFNDSIDAGDKKLQ